MPEASRGKRFPSRSIIVTLTCLRNGRRLVVCTHIKEEWSSRGLLLCTCAIVTCLHLAMSQGNTSLLSQSEMGALEAKKITVAYWLLVHLSM